MKMSEKFFMVKNIEERLVLQRGGDYGSLSLGPVEFPLVCRSWAETQGGGLEAKVTHGCN